MTARISKNSIPLWSAWWGIVSQLRPAFTRSSTFLWFFVALAATCARTDLRGVTSFVRALGLTERCHWRLLDMFHSSAVRRDELPALWSRLALALRESLPEFSAGFRETNPLAKIISENLDVDRAEGFRLAACRI